MMHMSRLMEQNLSRKSESKLKIKTGQRGVLEIKPNHDFYYQVQGQMNIYDVNWCGVLLRRRYPYYSMGPV